MAPQKIIPSAFLKGYGEKSPSFRAGRPVMKCNQIEKRPNLPSKHSSPNFHNNIFTPMFQRNEPPNLFKTFPAKQLESAWYASRAITRSGLEFPVLQLINGASADS